MSLEMVFCVLCLGGDETEEEVIHIFSTIKLAEEFCERDDRNHVVYSYVVDHPELTELMLQ